MGRYLLDTHSAIWFFNGDNSLSENAKQIIVNPANVKYLSVVSAWELSIKISIGKLRFPDNVVGFMQFAEESGFTVIPIKTAHLTALEKLPLLHRDPFDRLLTATAICEQLTFITADTNVAQYEVSQIW